MESYFCKNTRLKKSPTIHTLLAAFVLSLCMASCASLDVFEKNVAIPGQAWERSFKPDIEFEITDTAVTYNMYIVVRHRNAYNFNNIWVRGTVQEPSDTAVKSQQYDLKLADDQNGWFGEGMDDIFEHRILIQPATRFVRSGKYRFRLEHTMRQDPLQHVMNIGLRIEKTP
jgi:gliding motility-associated lipoprotein GldH